MTLAAWEWVDNLHRLAWPQRFTLIFLLVGGPLNLYLSTQRWIERPWRSSYFYKGFVCLLSAVWYVLLVTAVLDVRQFVQITRWLQPAVILALLISGIRHLGERHTLQRRAELRGQLVEQAVRVIEADEEKETDAP